MNKYHITYSARNEGAIGFPDDYWVEVEATDLDSAKELARAKAYENKKEHVHITAWQLIGTVSA